ncbi:MAG: tyrosine-type recombinase/integrase, partial [Thermodesulfobacteriota bacterium]
LHFRSDFRPSGILSVFGTVELSGHQFPEPFQDGFRLDDAGNAMTARLFGILKFRHKNRELSQPWVFWHTYWSSKNGTKKKGPFLDRKRIMKSLCAKAGVKYFRFHALRHRGASILENSKVPIGSIQRILGHENRTTTEIYLHSINDSERLAMDIFEKAREKSHTVSHTRPAEENV